MTMKTFRFEKRVLEAMKEQAAENPDTELMWLIGSTRPDEEIVDAYVPLEMAFASASGARADARSLIAGIKALAALGAKPIGLAHSHAMHGVFHSNVDDETVEVLLPNLADRTLAPPKPFRALPQLLSSYEALLVFPSGRATIWRLDGPEKPPGSGMRDVVSWEEHDIEFIPNEAPHSARRTSPDELVLEGGGLRLTLSLPRNGQLVSQEAVAFAPHRRSRLCSLVVNARGEQCAELMEVCVVGADTFTERAECDVVVTTDAGDDETEPGADDDAEREVVAFPTLGLAFTHDAAGRNGNGDGE